MAYNVLLPSRAFVVCQRINVTAGRNEALVADCGTGGRGLGESLGQEYFPGILLIC